MKKKIINDWINQLLIIKDIWKENIISGNIAWLSEFRHEFK